MSISNLNPVSFLKCTGEGVRLRLENGNGVRLIQDSGPTALSEFSKNKTHRQLSSQLTTKAQWNSHPSPIPDQNAPTSECWASLNIKTRPAHAFEKLKCWDFTATAEGRGVELWGDWCVRVLWSEICGRTHNHAPLHLRMHYRRYGQIASLNIKTRPAHASVKLKCWDFMPLLKVEVDWSVLEWKLWSNSNQIPVCAQNGQTSTIRTFVNHCHNALKRVRSRAVYDSPPW